MSAGLYELIALGMRYWFALLGVIIVLRSFLWLRRDRRAERRRLRRLPDAGIVGELVVVTGSRELPEGAILSLPWEGVMGFNRGCDVVIPCPGVGARHLDFSFEERRGLLLTLRRRCTCEVDGELLTPRSKARKHPMLHGSILKIGQAELRLRVFAGIDVEHHVQLAEELPPQPGSAAPYAPPMPPVPDYLPMQQPYPPYPQPPIQGWQAPPPQSWQQPVPVPPPMPPVPPAYDTPPFGDDDWAAVPQETLAPDMPPDVSVPELSCSDADLTPDASDQPAPVRQRHRRAGRRDADA